MYLKMGVSEADLSDKHVEHIIPCEMGGAYHRENYILLDASINNGKSSEMPTYGYCKMIGMSMCDRALQWSLTEGLLSQAKHDEILKHIKSGAPKRLGGAVWELRKRPKKYLPRTDREFKADIRESWKNQARVRKRAQEKSLEDPTFRKKKEKTGMPFCTHNKEKNCVHGTHKAMNDVFVEMSNAVKPDMRFKENRANKKNTDGSPDMRFKENRANKKNADGTPDMRFKEKRKRGHAAPGPTPLSGAAVNDAILLAQSGGQLAKDISGASAGDLLAMTPAVLLAGTAGAAAVASAGGAGVVGTAFAAGGIAGAAGAIGTAGAAAGGAAAAAAVVATATAAAPFVAVGVVGAVVFDVFSFSDQRRRTFYDRRRRSEAHNSATDTTGKKSNGEACKYGGAYGDCASGNCRQGLCSD
jgi:hypothetical protein